MDIKEEIKIHADQTEEIITKYLPGRNGVSENCH